MSKKRLYGGNFFPPDSDDPLYSIAAAGMNIMIGHGLKRLSFETAKFLGLSGVSAERQVALDRARAVLRREELEIDHIQEEKTRKLKLLDLRIAQKEVEISQRKLHLEDAEAQKARLSIPRAAQVICGALATGASPDGLVGPPDQLDACQRWLESNFDGGRTIVILGRKGSGKTVMAARTAEYAQAVYKKPTFWVGLPPEARPLLPVWISMADSVEQCPPNSVVICDESGLNYLSLAFSTDRNILMRKQLMISRHSNCTMLFCCQSSRDMDASILRMCDSFIWKEPGLHQPLSERVDMRGMAKQAAAIFSQIPREERCQVGYVFSDDFEGAVRCSVPSFWSEDLSHVYSNIDLVRIEEQGSQRKELQELSVEETKLLNSAGEEKQILELRRRDFGIERIAEAVGCSTWKVRKVLGRADTQK